LAADGIAFFISGGTHLDYAETSEGIRINALRSDVHPAEVVTVTLADETGGVIMHPVGIGLTEAGPFVARPLSKALEVYEFVIEVNATGAYAAFELSLTKARRGLLHIYNLSVDFENGIDVVEIWVIGAPKASVGEFACGGDDVFFVVDHVYRVCGEVSDCLPGVIDDDGGESHRGSIAGGITDLSVDGEVCSTASDVEIAGVNIYAFCLEAVIERKGLVDGAHDVEPDVAIDAAEVRVEVVGVPLEGGVGGALLI
jgi:hypothetical protein